MVDNISNTKSISSDIFDFLGYSILKKKGELKDKVLLTSTPT